MDDAGASRDEIVLQDQDISQNASKIFLQIFRLICGGNNAIVLRQNMYYRIALQIWDSQVNCFELNTMSISETSITVQAANPKKDK